MTAVQMRLLGIDFFERRVSLRLPFRFGAATVTQAVQAFVRVQAEVHGRAVEGATAELMVPKWFDKSPGLSHEDNTEQLRVALHTAAAAYQAHPRDVSSPWQWHSQAAQPILEVAAARGLPKLAAQFGPAQIDKAIADAALRSAGLGWFDGVSKGVLGDPYHRQLTWHRPTHVAVRHTVGLLDRLRPTDPGPSPADGLPETLADSVQRHGLRFFKLKLSAQLEADLDRLATICEVLSLNAHPDWRATLDGNENFADPDHLRRWWLAFVADPRLAPLRGRLLLLEQPLARAAALSMSIEELRLPIPVILDESDDDASSFERGLHLGYQGISSKACKGLYRSMASALRVQADPRLVLSGEDLTCQAGLAVQQDTALAASLGVAHIERNGHHYVNGFGADSDPRARVDTQAFANKHPHLYEAEAEAAHLKITQGRLDLQDLQNPHAPGYASACHPDWSQLDPTPA
jgi:hypothetical protein